MQRMTTLAAAVALAGCATTRPAPADIRFLDAHSHIVAGMDVDAEIARFREAGLAGVVIMDPDPAAIEALAKRYPDYVVPFISAARSPEMKGLKLNAETASRYAGLYAQGRACGFGEIPTRLVPNPDPSDAIAIANPFRRQVYAAANAHGVVVNVHVSLETPAVIAAVDRVAGDYPRMKLVLAHAGWSADSDTIGRLMAAHPNLYADLSVRLDPAAGWPAPGTAGPPVPNGITILQADGSIKPDWRALIERFPDRFLFGMDVTGMGTDRVDHIPELLATAQRALGPLPPGVQNAVAHGNLERLLNGCGR